jgi:membrane associated rhomboid family serine protease
LSYYRPRGFGGFNLFPPVIKNLLLINGVVFFLQVVGENINVGSGLRFSDVLTKYFALIPFDGFIAGKIGTELIIWSFYPWQLITYQFMHGGFSHILFNLFALWMFGMEIENLWGSKKFTYFYLLCGTVAGLFQLFIAPLLGLGGGPTIGASGAIFGILIAFGMLFPDRPIYLYFLIPVKAKYLIGFLIVLNILWLNEPGNVAYVAHLGGALSGFLFIMFDKSIDAPFKRTLMNLRSNSSGSGFSNPFNDLTERFRKKDTNIENAKFYDIDGKSDEGVSQEEIDRILDKISQSGYQNLSEREKKILFEASKKMN